MEYGHFHEEEREFVITRPDTTWPWINYLSNGRYCALTSHLGGGYSFYQDPRYRRITRYRYNNVPADRPGKYVYIRDAATGSYWSPTWQPVGQNLEQWQCRHGLGYTTFRAVYDGIAADLCYFVPPEDNLEIWRITLRNLGRKKRELQLFPYVEFALFDAVEEFYSHPNLHYFAVADFFPPEGAVIYDFFMPGRFADMGKVFFTLSNGELISGYDCDREQFIGLYRSENNPQVVEEGRSRNSAVIGGNAAGVLQAGLTLAPGAETTVSVFLGVTKNAADSARPYIEKYSRPEAVEQAFARLRQNWRDYLERLQVKTPEAAVDNMINTWNQYQCRVAFDWSRYASYFHTGTFRGIGFRDTSQDILGVMHAAPGEAAAKIKLLARHMYADGHSEHLFFPATGTGDPTRYSDDHLWIINAADSYVRETGDLALLEESVPYRDGGAGTLYEHMVRAIDYTLRHTGPHGLPRMFRADWNDCLDGVDREGRGESVWTAFQLHLALRQMAELAVLCGRSADAARFRQAGAAIRETINRTAWDGRWYIRAFTDAGTPLGSHTCAEGRIYLNPQSWAVISGAAPPERARLCMDAVHEHLATPYGLKLLHPPYRSFPPGVGSLLNYPPGLKENGAVFCHAHSWAVIAEAMLGRGDRAYQYYERILPPQVSKRVGQARYRVEPYVYCQFIFGPDHPHHGRASHSWLTGTAAWSFRSLVDWILGLRPTFRGLLIDPCLPSGWSGYEAVRYFRGGCYHIRVHKPVGICKGVAGITMDGARLDSSVLPLPEKGAVHRVEVEMGR